MDTNDVGLPAMPLGVQMLLPFALGYEVEIQQNTCELHRDSRSDTVAEAAPAKRTRKSMSRRTGQKGHIEQSGRWWVVRWWMDVEGKDERALKRARICPIAGPGKLTKSERQRRASEIIAESGADSEEHFNKIVKPQQQKKSGVTFKEHGEAWFTLSKTRKRKPVAESTVQFWRGCLDNWLIPNLGAIPISDVNNGAVKRLVTIMSKAGLSPKTITSYVQVVKAVVASAVNDEGEELFPRKWNAEFIDLPVVDRSKQNTPSFSAEVMSGLAKWRYRQQQMLFVLCGATGTRKIGRAHV